MSSQNPESQARVKSRLLGKSKEVILHLLRKRLKGELIGRLATGASGMSFWGLEITIMCFIYFYLHSFPPEN